MSLRVFWGVFLYLFVVTPAFAESEHPLWDYLHKDFTQQWKSATTSNIPEVIARNSVKVELAGSSMWGISLLVSQPICLEISCVDSLGDTVGVTLYCYPPVGMHQDLAPAGVGYNPSYSLRIRAIQPKTSKHGPIRSKDYFLIPFAAPVAPSTQARPSLRRHLLLRSHVRAAFLFGLFLAELFPLLSKSSFQGLNYHGIY